MEKSPLEEGEIDDDNDTDVKEKAKLEHLNSMANKEQTCPPPFRFSLKKTQKSD